MQTLNLVKMSLNHKNKYIYIKKTTQSTVILKFLAKLGIILGWTQKLNKNNILIYAVYCNLNCNKQIYPFIKTNKMITIKYKKIKYIIKNKSNLSVFLLTSKGILSLNEAFLKNVGGFLLFKIV